MRELIEDLLNWKSANASAAMTTVLRTWGSSPRPAGTHMAVRENGEFIGSVSGGCVESAVIEESSEVIHTRRAKRIKYGVTDEDAWEVGLACGGEIEVFITPVNWYDIEPILISIQAGLPTWYRIQLDNNGKISPSPIPKIQKQPPFIDDSLLPEHLVLYAAPKSQLVIIGGVNIAQHLIGFANLLGYTTIIVDPRRGFGSYQRFPDADQIVNLWPELAFKDLKITTNTAVAVLTHDDKIDLPAIRAALDSKAFYVGALGSKRTQERRKTALFNQGVASTKLDKIHGPIGIDLGAKSPSEIALAIMAEITAAGNDFKVQSPLEF